MFRLRAKLSIVRNLSPNQGRVDFAQRQVEKSLKRLIFRIALYPFTCVVSMLFYFIANVHNLLVGPSNGLLVIAMFGLALSGFLNLIAFLLDPTLHNAIRSMSNTIKLKLPYLTYPIK
ncbi:hypothetical protein L0F63_006025, partial [Massospora cicadina]